MKKLFTLLCLLMIMGAQSMAQKFALVDMESVSYTHLTLPTT